LISRPRAALCSRSATCCHVSCSRNSAGKMTQQLANVGKRGQGHDRRDFQGPRQFARPIWAGRRNAPHATNTDVFYLVAALQSGRAQLSRGRLAVASWPDISDG
jgi:hypothetical protein